MAKAVLLALVVLALVPAAAPGHAGETPGTDYRSTVRAAPDGIAVRMVGGDDRLLVTRTTAAEAVVLGYGGEPCLLLASVIVGAAPLTDAAGTAFAHALVPGPVPTVAVRLVIVVGIAGTALAAGATARALRDLLGTRPTAPARSSAW